MLSETMDKVIAAEKESAEKIENANKKSEEILNSAKENAKIILEQAKQEAEAETARLAKENSRVIDGIFEESRKKSAEEAKMLKEMAEAKKEKAVNMVIEKIV